jgi:hypothetical protein
MSSENARGPIYIARSGDASKKVARALHDLLGNVIQAADPWISEADIDKGARWHSEIEQKLEAALVGVIVLTPQNLTSPWLLFESGALSKKKNTEKHKQVLWLRWVLRSGGRAKLTHLAEAGTPEETMKSIMGHMSRAMLERYSHIRMQAKRTAIDGLSLPDFIEHVKESPKKVSSERPN